MSGSRRLLLLSLPLLGSAQHHHIDPFAGSGCNCSAFCANECAINATTAANTTLYRMTPFGVLGLAEKNTADVPGDTSFVISRRNQAYECKMHPSSSFGCDTMVQFEGDDPNSTDLVLEMQVEWDGQFGPYLYCNDLNASDPLGAWKCTTSLTMTNIPNYPKTCSAANYTGIEGTCFEGLKKKEEVVDGYGDCCALAESLESEYWSMDESSNTCIVYSTVFHTYGCNHTGSGFYDPPSNTCDCPRVHETVGKENITTAFGSYGRKYYSAGGAWYSHPHEGECKDGHYVGDGSGCTWRHVATTSAINASCMYNRIDTAIEKADPDCFNTCPPNNKTTDCYNKCYFDATQTMTREQLVAPWALAMSRTPEGCPQVDLSTVKAPAHHKPQLDSQRGGFVGGVW